MRDKERVRRALDFEKQFSITTTTTTTTTNNSLVPQTQFCRIYTNLDTIKETEHLITHRRINQLHNGRGNFETNF